MLKSDFNYLRKIGSFLSKKVDAVGIKNVSCIG